VRGDLIRILTKLLKRKNKFDHIMIEVGAAPWHSVALLPMLVHAHVGSSGTDTLAGTFLSLRCLWCSCIITGCSALLPHPACPA
jgi:hypothetical protein